MSANFLQETVQMNALSLSVETGQTSAPVILTGFHTDPWTPIYLVMSTSVLAGLNNGQDNMPHTCAMNQ